MTSRRPSRRPSGKIHRRRTGGAAPVRRTPVPRFPSSPGKDYADLINETGWAALLAVSFPVLAIAMAGLAFAEAAAAASRAFYRRRARIDRDFSKRCVERLQNLKGSPGAVYRRALRELVAERIRLEDGQAVQSLAGQPAAEAHRAKARSRRERAWNAWFEAVERAVAAGDPPLDLLQSPPGRRGAPIRRLCERSVLPPPTAEAFRAQWDKARGRGRVEEKIRLGSMLLDAEATVDSSPVRDGDGEIVGRRGGLREWIDETCPELSRHYAALMGYRRLAADFRREHGLCDPAPAALLLAEVPETERRLPPAQRASLPGARAKARQLFVDAERTKVNAFRARLLAMRDARRTAPAAEARRLA